MYHWYSPLDPVCPEAQKIEEWAQVGYDDPITEYYGASDVISDMYEEKCHKHRKTCQQCQEYGAANIEVRD